MVCALQPVKKNEVAAPQELSPAVMDCISDSTLYGWVAAFFAFLPFVLHLMNKDFWDVRGLEVHCQEVNDPDPVPVQEVYQPMLVHQVSDFEMSVINTLSEATREMTTLELQKSLEAFWQEADDMYGTLVHLYDQDILCMREEDGVYLWSVSA